MKLVGVLPIIRMTATIIPGRITNRVKIHGPKGSLGFHGGRPGLPRDSAKARRRPTGKRAGKSMTP